MTRDPEPTLDHWCIVELLGHRRIAGRVTEVTIAGAGMLQVDEPSGRTQLVSPAAVYVIHPVDELAMLAVANRLDDTAPIAVWELPEPWRKAIEAKPEDRCERCDHLTRAHGRDGCALMIGGGPGVDDARCTCAVKVSMRLLADVGVKITPDSPQDDEEGPF